MKQLIEHTLKDIADLLVLNSKQSIAPELLINAEFFQYGSALFIKLVGKGTVLLTDFFSAEADYFFYYAPEFGLPAELDVAETEVYYLGSEQLGDFLQAVANDVTLSSSNFDSLLLSTLSTTDDSKASQTQQESVTEGLKGEYVETSDGLSMNQDEITGPSEQGGAYQGEGISQQSLAGSESYESTDIATNESPVADEFAGSIVTAPAPAPVGPVSISRFSSAVDTLGTTSDGLSTVSGDTGSLISRASVDGLAGIGASSLVSGSLGGNSTGLSISGSLNSLQLSSVVPLSDASPGENAFSLNRTEIEINIDGQYTPTAGELAKGKITFKSLTTDTVAVDNVVFSNPENWAHFYKGSSYKETSTSPENGQILFFQVNGSTDPDSQKTNFYSPDFRHGAHIPIVDNTNISLYKILGLNNTNEHYAVSGAGDNEFVWLNAGGGDDDTLSFFNKSNPDSGDGDYDLVSNNNYLKITAIENIEILNTQAQQKMSLRALMPGFVLLDRSDYLAQHFTSLINDNAQASLFDAWCDFAKVAYQATKTSTDFVDVKSNNTAEQPKVKATWAYKKKPNPGFLVPISTGYYAISPLYPAGEVANVRDTNVPVVFAETAYSVGEWQSVRRLNDINAGVWRYTNQYPWYIAKAETFKASSSHNETIIEPDTLASDNNSVFDPNFL
mgnify:CR=1 FL=1